MSKRKLSATAAVVTATALGLAACEGGEESGADFPSGEITMIVPFDAGGGTDLIARQLASIMEEDLGQPVVVDNRPGGGSLVGMAELAAANPDGYTIGWATNSLITTSLTSDSPVPHEDFDWLALVNEDAASVNVHTSSDYQDLDDLIQDAQDRPEELRVSNGGPGGIWHIIAQMFEDETGTEFTQVPFDGGNPAVTALASQDVEVNFNSLVEARPMIENGDVRSLAVLADERHPQYEDVPTASELGIDLSIGAWRAILAPKGLDDEVYDVLFEAIENAVESEEFVTFMDNGGYVIDYLDGESFRERLDQEYEEYAAIIEGLED